MFCQPISLAKQNHPLGVLRSGRLRWRQASSPTSDGDATRRRRRRRRRAWRPSSSLQSEAEGRGDATKRGSFSRGGERGECCKDETPVGDSVWRTTPPPSKKKAKTSSKVKFYAIYNGSKIGVCRGPWDRPGGPKELTFGYAAPACQKFETFKEAKQAFDRHQTLTDAK